MRTCWIVSSALIGIGCSSTECKPAEPRNAERPTVGVSVPVRDDTGSRSAAAIVELAHARITRAYDVLAARWSCYMPAGYDSFEWSGPLPRPPLGEPGHLIEPNIAEWVRYETNQEDYDFLGVDVDSSPDRHSIVVTSKFGDTPGLARVADWIREKLKS